MNNIKPRRDANRLHCRLNKRVVRVQIARRHPARAQQTLIVDNESPQNVLGTRITVIEANASLGTADLGNGDGELARHVTGNAGRLLGRGPGMQEDAATSNAVDGAIHDHPTYGVAFAILPVELEHIRCNAERSTLLIAYVLVPFALHLSRSATCASASPPSNRSSVALPPPLPPPRLPSLLGSCTRFIIVDWFLFRPFRNSVCSTLVVLRFWFGLVS